MFDRGIPQTAVGGAIGLFLTVIVQGSGYLPQNILVTLAGGGVLAALAYTVHLVLSDGGGRIAGSIYAPSGERTKYTPTFSHIEALEARGDLEGAARAWDEACLEQPGSAMVLVRAADFRLRTLKDAVAAHDLYRRARALDTSSTDLRRYISQKLVDLYLGPLHDRGRAMTELRRLIDTFPDTVEAESAREVLMRMKAEDLGQTNDDARRPAV